MTHTPGQWSSVGGSIICGEVKIARCFGNVGDKQMLADANLIAASPDMLEALEALVECFIKRGPFDEPLGSSEQAPSINAGIAAIAKARGESA